MEIYCLLCGSKLIWDKEIDPDQLDYTDSGIVGVYHCSNEDSCNAVFYIIDLESELIDYNNIYDRRTIKYFFPDTLDL